MWFTVKKNSVLWDVTPCGSCKNRRFGGTYHLHHQGDKNRAKTMLALTGSCSMLRTKQIKWEWWRLCVPSRRRFWQERHGVTSQKTSFSIVTAVKTSDLTWITVKLALHEIFTAVKIGVVFCIITPCLLGNCRLQVVLGKRRVCCSETLLITYEAAWHYHAEANMNRRHGVLESGRWRTVGKVVSVLS
jgi:hypothetical protein